MAPDTDRPKRAAMAAALENPVWLNGKAPRSTSGHQKRPRSPDTSSTSTKKARNVAGKGTPLSKKPSKLGKHAVSTQPTAQVNAKVKTQPEARRKPAIPRRYPVQINSESDQDVGSTTEDDEDEDNNNDEAMRPQTDDEDEATEDDEDEAGEDDEDEVGEDDDNLCDLEPSVVRATFERERAKWGMDANANDNLKSVNATNNSRVSGAVDQHRLNALGDDEDCNQDDNPGLTKSKSTDVRAIGSRVANRLAEVPQWKSQPKSDSESTCQRSGTPFSSEGEEDGEADQSQAEDDQDTIKANRGWPPSCHYVPASSTRSLIKLRSQPSALRIIIRGAIYKAIGDAIFETAYRPVDTLTSYFRHTLWRSARLHNLMAYAKRFETDSEFGKAVGRVLNGRVSIFRGQVKKVAASKVEGYYQLFDQEQSCAQQIKDLIQGSTYIYPRKKGLQGLDLVRSKPFSHPAIIAVLRESFFTNIRGGSFASKNEDRFKSSLHTKHPIELEIPSAMLALAATSVHSALDDYRSGSVKKTEFNADMYEDIYLSHMTFLSHIREGSIAKYHRLMADLYSKVSTVSLPHTAIVTNDAIAQLDLNGMDE